MSSINLGTKAVEAARMLADSVHWKAIRDGIAAEMTKCLHASCESPAEYRHDLTGYARGVRDVWHAIEAATLGIKHQQVVKPQVLVVDREAFLGPELAAAEASDRARSDAQAELFAAAARASANPTPQYIDPIPVDEILQAPAPTKRGGR